MNKPSLLACGEVLWDLFPTGARFGGAPANFACHAALQGAGAAVLSAVGDDPRGNEALAILERFGLDTSLVQRLADAPTGSVKVTLDAAGKPGFEIEAHSAWDRISWTDALEARMADFDAVYFGTLCQRSALSRATLRRVVDLAKSRSLCRVLDVNLRKPFYDAALIRDSVALASVLKLSDDELPEVAAACGVASGGEPEKILCALLARFALDLVVMTRGACGALLVSPDQVVDQPGIPATVVDTVGAGDSFTAAFTVGILRGEALDTLLRRACETASAVCSQAGAVPDRA